MSVSKTLIIAEAGVNHNGDINLAKKLIDIAADAGADYVKFQTFKADTIVSKLAQKANYQKMSVSDESDVQYNMLKKLELSEFNHKELIAYCNLKNIKFLSTAFDVEGLKYLNSLDLKLFKSPSGELTNYPYLRQMASLGKPVILSTGMATLGEIEEAIRVLLQSGLKRDSITVLHCNTDYPTPMEDVNLKAMLTIQKAFKVAVGYSDHTLGIEVPIAAVALGASVIEKHFTIDRNLKGPDHRASLEPDEMKAMVDSIRNIEEAMGGSGIKLPTKSELKNKTVARKSIHVCKALQAGHTLSEKDLITLRPGDGISPMQWEQLIGRKIKNQLEEFYKLTWDDIL